jgi:hypothetical protein
VNSNQRQYYKDMMKIGRGQLLMDKGHVFAIVTFFIGDDDNKFLCKEPWTIIEDDPAGSTVYIDQFISSGATKLRYIHKEFPVFLQWIQHNFPNVVCAKWVRVNSKFRKHGMKEGVTSNVHTKSIK